MKGIDPDLPPIEWGEHLIDWLFEAGPVMAGMNGAEALTHAEIRAWALNTGMRLAGGEANALRVLSAEYAQELGRAAKGRAPYVAPKE